MVLSSAYRKGMCVKDWSFWQQNAETRAFRTSELSNFKVESSFRIRGGNVGWQLPTVLSVWCHEHCQDEWNFSLFFSAGCCTAASLGPTLLMINSHLLPHAADNEDLNLRLRDAKISNLNEVTMAQCKSVLYNGREALASVIQVLAVRPNTIRHLQEGNDSITLNKSCGQNNNNKK